MQIKMNMNMNMRRQCVHSCTQLVTYTGRTQAYLHLGTKGPQHFNSVLRSTAASTLSDVLVHAADLTGLMATVRRGSFKKTRIHARRKCVKIPNSRSPVLTLQPFPQRAEQKKNRSRTHHDKKSLLYPSSHVEQ